MIAKQTFIQTLGLLLISYVNLDESLQVSELQYIL